MTEKQYDEVLQAVTNEINEGIVLMTREEEVAYLKRIADDIYDWAEDVEDNITIDKKIGR